MKKYLLFPVLGLVLAGAAVFSVQKVSAQDGESSFTKIVERIAQRFNLNQDEVQAVFDEVHAEREAERQTNLEGKLNQAVADGKISEDQKAAILAKLAEMKTNRPDFEAFRNLSPEEQKAEMEKHREEMEQKRAEFETWLEQNGLTLEIFHEIMGFGVHGPRMGGHRMKM